MKYKYISIKYIVAVLLGIGICWLGQYLLKAKENPVESSGSLYHLVHREIESKLQTIELNNAKLKQLDNYASKLTQVANIFRSANTKIIFDTNNSWQISVRKYMSQLENAYLIAEGQYSIYLNKDMNDGKSVENTISESLRELNTVCANEYQGFWATSIIPDQENSNIFKDSAMLQARNDKIASTFLAEAQRISVEKLIYKASADSTQNQISTLNKNIDELQKSNKDRMLMIVVIPLFAAIVVLMILIPYLYKDNVEIVKELFENKIILQVLTVFILVMTILLLGVGDKINSETLGTLLGGISVYVLQRTLAPNN
ncbi:MAG: hypothetical protein JST52_06595 [Bacteroidetes bacterium]|nr:hypothetical protein [Bacteroidota bacterium]MBS1741340.1 hypothetical protein [Bacteroidota bacterium]